MSMQTWAEKEILIACNREREASGVKENDWDYGCSCYESALKAFKSLMADGHSGMSIGLTKQILNRLIEGKPLTPIEDTDDIWNNISHFGSGDDKYIVYQCKRMSSLFKYVYNDGSIKYSDVDNCYCVDLNNQSSRYHSGLVSRIIDEIFPITMPYSPGKAIAVYCEDFLTDKKNGDFDTRGIFYAVKPDGEKIEINRFFKESKDGWDEIDETEYNQRKSILVQIKMKLEEPK